MMVFAEDVLLRIIRINVARHEINRHILGCAEFQKIRNPSSHSGCGAAYFQLFINAFYCLGRLAIQIKILGLRSCPKNDIRLVPDFEFPLPDFFQSVSVDTVLSKRADQHTPVFKLFRRCCIALIPEDCSLPTSESFRHEAQFHKWSDSTLKHRVKDRVYIEKDRVGAAAPDAHLVVEESVKAHRLDANSLLHQFQV